MALGERWHPCLSLLYQHCCRGTNGLRGILRVSTSPWCSMDILFTTIADVKSASRFMLVTSSAAHRHYMGLEPPPLLSVRFQGSLSLGQLTWIRK